MSSLKSTKTKIFIALTHSSFTHFFQGYGSTEGGGISRMICREECSRLKSAGRLAENVQVKIVDPNTGMALSVGQPGELWLKSPACMTGT